MFLSINELRLGRSTPPFASIAVLMVVGMLLALPASAQNNNGSGSEGKDPVINGFKPFGDIELPWNNQTGAYDSVTVKSSQFTATDPGLAQPAKAVSKEVKKGVGYLGYQYGEGSWIRGDGDTSHDPKNKYYFEFTVRPKDMGNKKTAQSPSGTITIDATALGLKNAVATQPSVTITLGSKGGNGTTPPLPLLLPQKRKATGGRRKTAFISKTR